MIINNLITKWKNMGIELKASFAYTFCSVLQNGLAFLTLPLFTRLLSTSQYGQATVYSSWENLIAIFVTLNLAYGSFDTAMIKYEEHREKYMAAVNGLCTALCLVFVVIYLPFAKLLNKLFELPTFIMLIMIGSILANNSLLCWYKKLRFEYRYQKVVLVTLSLTVVSVLLQLAFIMLSEEKGYARIIGIALTNILFGGCIYLYYLRREKLFYDKQFWSYALSFNVPLIAYYVSQIIFNTSDRIMISHFSGMDKAAIYSVAYNLAVVLNVVLNSINASYTPWLYTRIKDGNGENNKKVTIAIAMIMSVLLLGIIACAPELIEIMASEKYAQAKWVVPPVAMSILYLFYAQLFIAIEFYFEEKKYLVYGTILSAIINIILNVICIPVFGFIAAAYTTLASYIVFVVMNYYMYKKIIIKRNMKDDLFNYRLLILIAVLFMACGFGLMALYNTVIIRYVIIAISGIIVLIKRNAMMVVYKRFKNGEI